MILPKIHTKKKFGLQPSQTNKRTIVTTLLMQLSILWSILISSYFMAYAIVKESQWKFALWLSDKKTLLVCGIMSIICSNESYMDILKIKYRKERARCMGLGWSGTFEIIFGVGTRTNVFGDNCKWIIVLWSIRNNEWP